MKIFVDPSELTEQSLLEKAVVEVATPLPGLEEKTGADLLMSNQVLPLTGDSPEAMLRVHTENGILVQLKRFDDLQQAISTESRLFRQILSMKVWTSRPWLVVTGHMFEINGKATIGKLQRAEWLGNEMARFTVVGRMGMSFQSVDGAIDAWQYYGGYAKFLPDEQLLNWLQRQSKLLRKINSGSVKELKPRGTQREIRGPGRVAWLSALFDGIGPKTSQRVWDRLDQISTEYGGVPPQIIDGVAYVTDYRAAEISGITEDAIKGWRDQMGLKDHGDVYQTIGIEHRAKQNNKLLVSGARHDEKYIVHDQKFIDSLKVSNGEPCSRDCPESGKCSTCGRIDRKFKEDT